MPYRLWCSSSWKKNWFELIHSKQVTFKQIFFSIHQNMINRYCVTPKTVNLTSSLSGKRWFKLSKGVHLLWFIICHTFFLIYLLYAWLGWIKSLILNLAVLNSSIYEISYLSEAQWITYPFRVLMSTCNNHW